MSSGIGLIGAGTMGVGIAYVFAAAGCDVAVVEPDVGRQRRLLDVVRAQAAQGVERGKLSPEQADALPSRLGLVGSATEFPRGLEVIVESVPERLELKREVLADAAGREPMILATNTSSFSIDELAASLPEPGRFLGMHFFNPVWSLRLVEIIRGTATTPDVVEQARSLATLIGKESVVVRDVPGFATSRLDLTSALEAMRMVESGVASAADIDRAVVLAYRHPVGPLRLSDIVGLDVRLDIARHLADVYGPRFEPPQILVDKVAANELGQKTGRGFFDWSTDGSTS